LKSLPEHIGWKAVRLRTEAVKSIDDDSLERVPIGFDRDPFYPAASETVPVHHRRVHDLLAEGVGPGSPDDSNPIAERFRFDGSFAGEPIAERVRLNGLHVCDPIAERVGADDPRFGDPIAEIVDSCDPLLVEGLG
jgi:hypothetical protein